MPTTVDEFGGGSVQKRQKTSLGSADTHNGTPFSSFPVGPKKSERARRRYPHSIVTWNCNGFTSRCNWNVDELRRFVNETGHPDMICIQEARLRAAGPDHLRGKPMDSEYHGAVEDVLQTPSIFGEYVPVWSLADNKYAGTLTLLHKRCFGNGSDDGADETILTVGNRKDISSFAAFTPQSAINLLLRRFGTSRSECDIGVQSEPTKSANQSESETQVPPKKAILQTSMKSFFAAKPKVSSVSGASISSPNNVMNSRCPPKVLPSHHPEGRFQFFAFPDLDVLQTYVPNNGIKEESFQRRRDWDRSMLQFLRDRKKILQRIETMTYDDTTLSITAKDRPLLWCGDLNVARDYRDGSHWEMRTASSSLPNNTAVFGQSVYEWWTDESKCFVQGDRKSNSNSRTKRLEDVGIPSFTLAERNRFQELLSEGDFSDIWRELHPNGVGIDEAQVNGNSTNNMDAPNRWDLPNYTWRGHLSVNTGSVAKYQGKGQRLDYFLLSPSRLVTDENDFSDNFSSIVQSCDILGYGERREGMFCGSDHCALQLKLNK
jgi:exonuclease III